MVGDLAHFGHFVGRQESWFLFASGVVNKKLGPMMDDACRASIHSPPLLDILQVDQFRNLRNGVDCNLV